MGVVALFAALAESPPKRRFNARLRCDDARIDHVVMPDTRGIDEVG